MPLNYQSGALWHLALCVGQTPARRIEAAGNGLGILQNAGVSTSANWHPGDGTVARNAAGTHPLPQIA